MSLNRLNSLLMSNILPFNFGMDYEAWVRFYDNAKGMPQLCPTDPRTWDEAKIARVNATAQEQKELHARLMALSNDEFYAEVERLRED